MDMAACLKDCMFQTVAYTQAACSCIKTLTISVSQFTLCSLVAISAYPLQQQSVFESDVEGMTRVRITLQQEGLASLASR